LVDKLQRIGGHFYFLLQGIIIKSWETAYRTLKWKKTRKMKRKKI
jgi:hypothetical protein